MISLALYLALYTLWPNVENTAHTLLLFLNTLHLKYFFGAFLCQNTHAST